jgi:hypothetical protein
MEVCWETIELIQGSQIWWQRIYARKSRVPWLSSLESSYQRDPSGFTVSRNSRSKRRRLIHHEEILPRWVVQNDGIRCPLFLARKAEQKGDMMRFCTWYFRKKKGARTGKGCEILQGVASLVFLMWNIPPFLVDKFSKPLRCSFQIPWMKFQTPWIKFQIPWMK